MIIVEILVNNGRWHIYPCAQRDMWTDKTSRVLRGERASADGRSNSPTIKGPGGSEFASTLDSDVPVCVHPAQPAFVQFPPV